MCLGVENTTETDTVVNNVIIREIKQVIALCKKETDRQTVLVKILANTSKLQVSGFIPVNDVIEKKGHPSIGVDGDSDAPY